LVVERERAIRDFKPAAYFDVLALIDAGDSKSWRAVFRSRAWSGEEYFQNEAEAEMVASVKTLEVSSYLEGESREGPPAPFTTSALQQAASDILKLDPRRTMEAAQRLYEGGHVTYPRTDSPNISQEAVKAIRGYCLERGWPVSSRPRTFKAVKGAQEAHEAIRPTRPEAEEAGGADRALYELIRVRALASQLEEAAIATVKAVLKGSVGGREAVFDARGRRLSSQGWRVVLGGDRAFETERGEERLDNPIPRLARGSVVNVARATVRKRTASAPPRLTEAALIRELERRGVGRPSTYAAILDNIKRRGYVEIDKSRRLKATPLGEELISRLKSGFKFADYDFTRSLETKLDGVAAGRIDYLSVVSEVHVMIKEEIANFKAGLERHRPDCGKISRRLVKEGVYDFRARSDRGERGAEFEDAGGEPGERSGRTVLSDRECQVCGKKLRHMVKEGEWNFWGCSDRACGATYNDDGGKPGPLKAKKAPPSKYKRPMRDSPLYRRKGVSRKTGKEYDFFSCPNRSCDKTYNGDGDKPVFSGEKAGAKSRRKK
jgi:DNA topoisomerase-1